MSITENLAQLRDMAVRVEAIEAAAKAMAADVGLDLDNLAASADPGDTEDQLDAWRKNWIEEARIAYEAIAPLVRQAERADVAREILTAGHDTWLNLSWMYPEQAAALAIGEHDAASRGHKEAAKVLAARGIGSGK